MRRRVIGMGTPRIGACLLLLSCATAGPLARGDVLFLAHGGRIEGTLLNRDESPRKTYVVQIDPGGRITLRGDQVARVVVKSQAERSYEAFLPRVPDTAEGHWDVAERCAKAGLEEQRLYHLQQVLRHDPDHEGARRALGYSRIDGRWARQQEWLEKQGYVRHGGTFRLPQEVELQKLAEREEQQLVEWRKKLKLWTNAITSNRGKGAAEAEAFIRAIRDPAAARALAELLGQDRQPRGLRQLYSDVLAQLGGHVAATTLVRIALQDPDASLRDRCLDHLASMKSPLAVPLLCRALQSEQNAIVQRAAAALARIKDPSATLPLIRALITEHKQMVGGGGIQPSFTDQGGGLSVGGGPKIVKQKIRNESVLTALTVMYPGVNFGYDQQRWKNWFVQKSTPASVDLRRSD